MIFFGISLLFTFCYAAVIHDNSCSTSEFLLFIDRYNVSFFTPTHFRKNQENYRPVPAARGKLKKPSKGLKRYIATPCVWHTKFLFSLTHILIAHSVYTTLRLLCYSNKDQQGINIPAAV